MERSEKKQRSRVTKEDYPKRIGARLNVKPGRDAVCRANDEEQSESAVTLRLGDPLAHLSQVVADRRRLNRQDLREGRDGDGKECNEQSYVKTSQMFLPFCPRVNFNKQRADRVACNRRCKVNNRRQDVRLGKR